MKQLKMIAPIGDGNAEAIPVRTIDPAMKFYTHTLGFAVSSQDDSKAVLVRDDVQIRLIQQADHDPDQAGSFYLDVADLEALRAEFEANGATPSPIRFQAHEGQNYRVFFLRECDMLEVHDGYCFCFGHQV